MSRLQSRISGTGEPVQMSIYESTTYRKDLSWLHFYDELKIGVSQ